MQNSNKNSDAFKSQKKVPSPDFSFLKNINPGGGTMNCADCTIAVTKVLKGKITPNKLKPVARNPKTAVPTQPVKKNNRLVASRISSEDNEDFVKLMRSINPDYTEVVYIDNPNDINPYFATTVDHASDIESKKKIGLTLVRSTIKKLSEDLLEYAPRNNPMKGNPYCSKDSAFGIIVLTLKNSSSLLGHILNYYIDDRHKKIYLLDGQEGKIIEKISDNTFLQTVYWCACQPDSGFRPLVKKEKNEVEMELKPGITSEYCLGGTPESFALTDPPPPSFISPSPYSNSFFADRSLHSSENRKRKNPEPETASTHLDDKILASPERQWQMGICYLNGVNGVEKNEAEAARLFWLSATQGYAASLNSLGYCYWNGLGVEADINEAAKLFHLAADKGLMSAQYNLARCYLNGRGTEKDHKEAERLFRLAADQGHAQAQRQLDLYYGRGTNGPEKNETEVKIEIKPETTSELSVPSTSSTPLDDKIAASPERQWQLGMCYAKGIHGVEKNEAEAARLFLLSAAQGYAASLNSLGYCYWKGLGVKADINEAVKLYRLAADKGAMSAQHNLAHCYRHGMGVEKDHKEAVRLFRLAADQGHAQAQWSLGVYYALGINGMEKNEVEAARLFRLAADQGYAGAQWNLGLYYALGINGMEKNEVEAARLFRLAADQGHARSLFRLAKCYSFGIGVEKNVTEALRLYHLAVERGFTQSVPPLKDYQNKTPNLGYKGILLRNQNTYSNDQDSGLNQKSNFTSNI